MNEKMREIHEAQLNLPKVLKVLPISNPRNKIKSYSVRASPKRCGFKGFFPPKRIRNKTRQKKRKYTGEIVGRPVIKVPT